MLHLTHRTPPEWARFALADVPRLLADQLSCEHKAAAAARMMTRRFGAEQAGLDVRLAELAREEAAHATLVERLQREHGWAAPPGKAEYTGALRRAAMQAGGSRLDLLLVSGLIEARSCERFKLLSERLADQELAQFYRDLMESEARHYRLFCGLSETLFGAKLARDRLAELARREAKVAGKLPLGPKVHG